MKMLVKNCIKVVLFLLPFVVICIPILFLGEYFDGGDLVQMQLVEGRSTLYGPISESQYRYYKAETARKLNPSVLILGASRSVQIREFFFDQAVIAYNAGFAATYFSDMQYFLQSQNIDDLDTLIIPIDHIFFNANIGEISYPEHDNYITPTSGMDIASQISYTAKALIAGKSVWGNNLFNFNIIGTNAKINLNGMLNDGSYYYGETYAKIDEKQSAEYQIADTLARIKRGDSHFQHGDEVNTSTLYYLEQLLQYCKDNKVHVIAYAPPYAPSVNKAMEERGDAYAYQYKLLEIAPRIFDKYQFEYFDYTDASFLNCTDRYYVDGFHGSDVVFLRMFIDMVKRGSQLGKYCTIETLQKYDESRYSDTRIFGTWEQYNDVTLQRRRNA